MQAKWEQTLFNLKKKISEEIFAEFFEKATIKSLTDTKAIVVLPENIEPKEVIPYKGLLEISWQETTNSTNRMDFELKSFHEQYTIKKIEDVLEDSFTQTSVPLNKLYTFESFVPGDKALLAYNAAFAVAENSDNNNKYNPLFIYGAPGLGKTHLLQAIGNHILENEPEKKVRYLTAHDFYSQYIRCVREKRLSDLAGFYRSKVDVLLIDDIQNWSGMEETQNEFFHIFNALHQANKQIVLTSDVPAVEVKNLAERLVSRFSWGLTVDIQPPNTETRIAILHKKALEQHITIAENVIAYLAEYISGNVRLLESAITKLTVQASVLNHDIDLGLAKQVVANLLPTIRRRVNVSSIIQTVANHYEIPVDKLLAPGRGNQEVAKTRQIAMYLVKELSTLSLQGIGRHFGNRDHATVIHATKSIKNDIAANPNFAREIETIKNSIRE